MKEHGSFWKMERTLAVSSFVFQSCSLVDGNRGCSSQISGILLKTLIITFVGEDEVGQIE